MRRLTPRLLANNSRIVVTFKTNEVVNHRKKFLKIVIFISSADSVICFSAAHLDLGNCFVLFWSKSI